MNPNSQRKQKDINPKGKPSRAEIGQAMQPYIEQIARASNALNILADFLCDEKKLFTADELKAFIATKQKAAAVPAQAPQSNPPTAEIPCQEADTTSTPSSTPTTA